jgi:xylulose-5-phosphate/fructose-6-phosphate phosphoketolase
MCRGYTEVGITTPFDMVMLNDVDRYHRAIDVLDRVAFLTIEVRNPAPAGGRQAAHRRVHGDDLPGGARLGMARCARRAGR